MSNKVTFTVSRFLASGDIADTRTYQRGYFAGLRLEAMAHDMVRANAGLDTQDGHRVMEDASHAVESVLRGGMVSHTVWARGARVVISRTTAEPGENKGEPTPEMVPQPVQQAQCNAGAVSFSDVHPEGTTPDYEATARRAGWTRVPHNGMFNGPIGSETRLADYDSWQELCEAQGINPEGDSSASAVSPAATVIRSAQSIRDTINPAHLARISEASPDLFALLSEISRLSVDEHGNPVPVTLDEETRDNISAVLSWCEGLI